MSLLPIEQMLNIDEFVIDEHLMPITLKDSYLTAQKSSSGTQSSSLPEMPDLLGQIGSLLIEQVKLQEQAKYLQASKGDDEFGRFVRQLIPFIDSFGRMIELAREHESAEDLEGWIKSLESLYFRLATLLEDYGFRFINSVGKIVNLDYHEVVDYRVTRDYPDQTVIKELQKGIVFRDRLLREAKVIVACAPE